MASKTQHIALKTFQPWKIYLAITLGLCVSAFQFHKGLDGQKLSVLIDRISNPNWLWLIAAVLVLVIRDLGYMFRIKNITKHALNWKSSFYTIVLWEFASAITPSVVGGTAVAIFILKKEGLKIGKSIAYVTLTAILDNLFFILAAPFGMLLAKDSAFFSEIRTVWGIDFTLSSVFFISYSIIAFYTLFMAFGVLINPKIFQKTIALIAKILNFKDKTKRKAYRLTLDNILAAKEIKNLGLSYWLKAIGSTLFVWSARYFMLNCLLAAYYPMDLHAHQVAFGKQLILWVSQLISPTPGASGFAEAFMEQLFGASLIITSITLLWRFFTYYTYLGLGAIFLPKWLKKTSVTDN